MTASARALVRVAVGLLALDLLLVSAHLLLVWRIVHAPQVDVYIAGLVAIPTCFAFLAVGVLIVTRHPEQRFGWLLILVGLSWETWVLIGSYADYAYGVHGGEPFGSRLALWVSSWLFFPCLCLTVAVVPLLFPSGRPPAGRWRWVYRVAIIGMCSVTLGFMLEPITLEASGLPASAGIMNPYRAPYWVVNTLFVVGLPLAILAGGLAGVSIVLRLRRSRGVERQQLKWFAFGGAFVAAIFVANTVMFVVDHPQASLVFVGQALSFAAIPIAAGIAIVRHQLFDIDRLINRTLVYGVLSLSVGAIYVLLILLPTAALDVGGSAPDLLIAAATLAVAALFRPLRARIQRIVDRRFNRAHYDAEQTVERFAARLRDDVELTALTGDLTDVVQATMQPAHVSLWLRPEVRRP